MSEHYLQIEDINMPTSNNWRSIGTSGDPFTGSYDRNGKKISNLSINRTSENYMGLFDYVSGSMAVVKSVVLVNCNISGGGGNQPQTTPPDVGYGGIDATVGRY
jgi:hypothetical protein